MTNQERGFTLIELLVVVLIIGILAAVALPQYQKAVYKAKAIQTLTMMKTYQKAIDAYVLEHGYQNIWFVNTQEPDQAADTVVDFPEEKVKELASYYDGFIYAWCSDTTAECSILVGNMKPMNVELVLSDSRWQV